MDLGHQYQQQQYYNPYVARPTAPLPPGWMEYRTPTGQPYWYNSFTSQSSWTYPAAVNIPPAIPLQPKKKKQIKKKIPGTHWLFVLTHDGYEFYYDRETKTSVWEMPEELKEPMEELKKLEEKEKEEKKLKEEEEAKKKLEEETAAAAAIKEEEENRKRKAVLEAEEVEAKRIKLQEENGEITEADNDQQEQEEEQEFDATEMTEQDIMWQLQQMAEQEIEQEQQQEQQQQQEEVVPQEQQQQQPPKMTEEECIEKFNELLKERNISPFAMYSTEYPHLVTDARFSLVPSNKQKTLFNKYCNALGEQIKNEKKSDVKKPEDQFIDLLQEKVITKMYWDDFRRKFKDDVRFKALKITKEKETLFKHHIKNNLNKKKSSPKDDYVQLLQQTSEIKQGIRWRDAKKILELDDRYFAIEDKEKREDLFRDYLDGLL